jgi:hypothetical protein
MSLLAICPNSSIFLGASTSVSHMIGLSLECAAWPALLTRPIFARDFAYLRSVPLTTISTLRLWYREQTSRSRQTSRVIPAPYRRACSSGSGST